MSEFGQIEKEYLKIDPLSEDLIQFYEKHLGYFKHQHPIDDEELGKYICMLAEIGQTYSLTEKHEQAYPILDRAI